jgi:hypothetical protein
MKTTRAEDMLELMRSLFIFVLFSAAFAGFSWAAEGPGGGGEPGKEAEPAKEAEQPPENPPEIGGDELQGEGRGSNTEGWDQYVDFIEGSIKYLPPSEAGGSQAVEFKFNLSPDVPKGAKVKFVLEYNGLEMDTLDYVLKDENRKSLAVTWKPKQRLATGEYFFRVKMPLKEQTAAVQRIIQGKAKRFPKINEPWAWFYGEQDPDGKFKHTLVIGSPEDEEAEKKIICDLYTDYINRLIESMTEFLKKMERVKDGKELTSGGSLEVPQFKSYVAGWRKKQGAIQKEIYEFPLKEPALHLKSQTAFPHLVRLGQMVSKRGWQVQDEVTKQYGVKDVINPAAEGFNRNYKYKVTKESLNQTLGRLDELVCPKNEAEAGTEGQPDGGTEAQEQPAGEESKGAEVQEGAGEAEKEAEKSKPEENEKKPAKKTTKKSAKKTTKKSESTE